MPNLFIYFPHSATDSSGPGPPHYRGFTIISTYTTLDRTSPNELSALTTHNIHKRKHPCPRRDWNPQFQEGAAADPRLRLLFHERHWRSLQPFPTSSLHPVGRHKTETQ